MAARGAEAAESYRSAYLAAGAAMARLTLAGVVIDANLAFADLIGRTQAMLEGRPIFDLLHEDDSAALRAGRLSTFREGRIRALLRFRAENRIIWGRTTITLARRADDRPDSLILTVEDVTASREREAAAKLRHLHDPVTGLPNATLLVEHLAGAIVAARAADQKLAVILFEINGLGAMESALGAGSVDELLGHVAGRLRGLARPSDSVGRMAANEFAIVLGDVAETDLAAGVGRRILAGLEPEYRIGGSGVEIEMRIGVALLQEDTQDADGLLRQARLEMYLGGAQGPAVAAAAPAPGLEGPAGESDSAGAGGNLGHRVEVLEPVSLFLDVPDSVLRRIARYLSEQTAGAGEDLVNGASPPALRIIDQGTCEVSAAGTGELLSLLTLGPGDFIGPDSMFVDNPLPVRVRALTECRFVVLDGNGVERTAPPGSAFREALRKAAAQRDSHLRSLIARTAPPSAGSVPVRIGLYSTKGGSGRTTLALNLAAELGRRHPGEVLIVDVALPYNHVALMANLSPSSCLARIAQAPDPIFRNLAWSAALPHPAGFLALPSILRPEEAELVTPQLLTRALTVLAPNFKYVIFDLGSALDDCVLDALELTDQLLLVTTPELASMHDTRQLMDLATDVLQIPSGRVHAVLNHRSPDSAMGREVVEQVLGQRMAAEFSYYGAKPELTGLSGRLQVQADPRSPFSRMMKVLADHLVGQQVGAASSA